MAKAKRKREQWTFLGWIVLLLILWAYFLFDAPLFLQQVFGTASCEEIYSDYFERKIPRGRHSYEWRSYFALENGVNVRIPKAYLLDMGLSEDELISAEGTKCTVYYVDFPCFDDAYHLISISNGEELRISEEVTTAKYRENEKAGNILLGVFTSIVMLFLLPPRIWKLVKKYQKEKRKQEKRARRQMVLAARQKSEIEKNFKENEGSKHPNNE